jgi:FixJ family two-component response regulator
MSRISGVPDRAVRAPGLHARIPVPGGARGQAERALGIIQDRPDISGLITDVELSGKTNGFELATAVSEARPQLPIVIVSGRAAPDPERMPKGAKFIARPCTGEDILSQLKGLLPC